MSEPISMADYLSGRSDYLDAVRLHNELFVQRCAQEQARNLKPCSVMLQPSVPLQVRLDEIDRVYAENVARINRERDENIAAIDRKYKLVDQALSMGLPDPVYWLWVGGFVAAAVITQLLRGLP